MSYIAFLGFGIAVAVVRESLSLPLMSRQAWLQTRGTWLWINSWIMWTIFSYLYSSQSEIATQRLITGLEMAAMIGVFLYVISLRDNARALGMVMALVVVLGSVLNILDFVTPTFSKVPGRAAGLYINPTISGFILVLAVTSAIPAMNIPQRWILLCVGSVGIFLTFSRASWLLLFASIVWLFWNGYLGMRRQRSILGMIALSAVALLVYSIMTGALAELVLNTSLRNYVDSNTLARLGQTQFATDHSADEREAVVWLALNKFMQSPNPFLGYGLALTHEWEFRVSTHNMYLMFLIEGGFLGLTVYVSMLAILWQKAAGIAKLVTVQFVIFGLFSHNILDSPGRVFFIALVASGALGSSMQKNSGRKPNADRCHASSI